ncbi:MAG: lycopene cyclase domain-containing protein [Ignavibacteriaceae bacterium]
MKFEYLIFNGVVVSGPALFGSLNCCYIWNHWKQLVVAIVIPAIPFLLWDVIVTGAHWNFNPKYVSGIKIINLPIEEILFFITVPFACLFTWEMIIRRAKEKTIKLKWLRIFYLLLIVVFTLIFNGFLTWLPVVTYGVEYQLDFRIITIPVEDFFYGISLLFMNTSVYSYLVRKNGAINVNQ